MGGGGFGQGLLDELGRGGGGGEEGEEGGGFLVVEAQGDETHLLSYSLLF